jgi:predicted transcriptional regulator
VKSAEDFREDAVRAFETGESKGYAEHSFPSADRLFEVVSSKRWDILTVMAAAGEMSIREVSRRVGRDVKAVHGDVVALIKNGVIERRESGKVIFPYDYFHLSLSNRQAAA